MSTGFKVFSVKKRDFRHNIWLKRANQKRKYSDQPKKQASYRLLYSLIGWESISSKCRKTVSVDKQRTAGTGIIYVTVFRKPGPEAGPTKKEGQVWKDRCFSC